VTIAADKTDAVSSSTTFARRRAAFLEFPRQSFFESVIDRIADEGYDDVSLLIIPDRDNMGNAIEQGFTVAQGRQMQDWCHRRGLSVIIFTGYMKYEEPLLAKEPQRAMVTFGSRDQLDSDGVASQWLCPFQPVNRQRYWDAVIAPVLDWPALRHIDLNDEAFLGFPSGAIGCYCNYCESEFRNRFGVTPPRRREADEALWHQWIADRGRRWTEFHAGLREQIRELRSDVTVGIQHSPCAPLFQWNNGISAVDLGRDAAALDGLCTDPYHFLHLSVATLRPHRRLLTEATRSLAGACGEDRQIGICAQGFMPPANSTPIGRQDGLLAAIVPFALGANFVFPYTNELSRIIAGFDEGWREAAKLIPSLRETRPAPFVAVLASMKTEAHAHPDRDWAAETLVPLMDVMHRVGLPWEWMFDERLTASRTWPRANGPLIVPSAVALTAEQLQLIDEHRQQGILWIGDIADGTWPGHGVCRVDRASVRRGPIALKVDPAFAAELGGLSEPLILSEATKMPSSVRGRVVGTIDGEPGLVVDERDGGRTAWIAGTPVLHVQRPAMHAAVVTPSESIPLLRQLLLWLSPQQPIARFDPQPLTDYSKLRPWDVRGISTAELFPMLGDRGLLMLIFPYLPLGFDATVRFHLQGQRKLKSLVDLWSGSDLTSQADASADGSYRLPIRFNADCDVMALWASF